ncbi:MAG: GNAT family N-acetyltransferase [Acidimicrobiales bacterium]|nr:GNAT family N-acetyltransferase [Acidimicrobiales bacterium]
MSDGAEPITIRRAGTDDLELVVARRIAFFGDTRGWTIDEMPADFVVANRAFIERTHGHTFLSWLAEADGGCVGIVSAVVSDAPPRPEDLRHLDAYIVNMHVDRDHRTRGVGRLLVDACMAECEAMGVRRFSLFTTEDGRPLYESVGFSDHYGWMNHYVSADSAQ